MKGQVLQLIITAFTGGGNDDKHCPVPEHLNHFKQQTNKKRQTFSCNKNTTE